MAPHLEPEPTPDPLGDVRPVLDALSAFLGEPTVGEALEALSEVPLKQVIEELLKVVVDALQ